MKQQVVMWTLAALPVLALGLSGCGSDGGTEDRAVSSVTPSREDAGNIAYSGVYEDPVQLDGGRFVGEPFVEGASSRPTVQLIEGMFETGDVNGDGHDEAAVLLAENSGGSGTRIYLAVVGDKNGVAANLATCLVGDRTQIRRLSIDGAKIALAVIQHGPDDAACCPTEKATRMWTLQSSELVEAPPVVDGPLSIADLSGVVWVLTDLGWGEPAPDEPEVTLQFDGTRITGSSGCNRYFGDITESSTGAVSVGPIGGTKRACPEAVMALEQRFLGALGHFVGYGFMAGNLVLTCKDGDTVTTLMFAAREAE